MYRIALAGHLFILVACGGPRYRDRAPSAPAPVPVASVTPLADKAYRPPGMPWWRGGTPVCSTGDFRSRSLSWGALYWCALPGQMVDSSLQNDLGRLARCVHESVNAFQQEPGEQGLGAFLSKAHESGLHPVLCGAVRRDREVRTYHGREVLMERVVEATTARESKVRYRFGCKGCVVAAETYVDVATP